MITLFLFNLACPIDLITKKHEYLAFINNSYNLCDKTKDLSGIGGSFYIIIFII